jgi:hypothetical protein
VSLVAGGSHGCPPVEVFPKIFTAHYHDVDSREKLMAVLGPNCGPVLVVNSAVCQCEARPGFFGEGVDVMLIEGLEDDPDERKQFDAGKATTSSCTKANVEPLKRCAGAAKKDFDRVSRAIADTLARGGCVLCHCHASISRSAAFIVAHLVKTGQSTTLEGLRAMKLKWGATWVSARSCCCAGRSRQHGRSASSACASTSASASHFPLTGPIPSPAAPRPPQPRRQPCHLAAARPQPCDTFVMQLLEYEREQASNKTWASLLNVAAVSSFATGMTVMYTALKVFNQLKK